MKFATAAAFASSLALSAIAAPFTCTTPADTYTHCVHVQSENAPDGGKWPVMVFLPGSGARGPASQAASLATYDGQGKMISEYYSGNKEEGRKLAAEEFLTVVVLRDTNARHFFDDKIKLIVDDIKSKYNVDPDRIHLSGYSMGSRSTWRNLANNPDIWASGVASAGACEDSNADTLRQEPASEVWSKLKNILNIPVRHFAGLQDTTAGYVNSDRTQAQIESLGGKLAKLSKVNSDHAGLSTLPWADQTEHVLQWVLKQRRSGAVESPSTKKASASTSAAVAPAATKAADPCASAKAAARERRALRAKRDLVPFIYARQSHHHVFDHSRRDVPIDDESHRQLVKERRAAIKSIRQIRRAARMHRRAGRAAHRQRL